MQEFWRQIVPRNLLNPAFYVEEVLSMGCGVAWCLLRVVDVPGDVAESGRSEDWDGRVGGDRDPRWVSWLKIPA